MEAQQAARQSQRQSEFDAHTTSGALKWLSHHTLSLHRMGINQEPQYAVRYRGFVLLQQNNHSWLVRPERSPMRLLPFRTPTCSLEDVKALVDWRLEQETSLMTIA